ncbi:MAG: DUF748 domain-containing protein [Cyclobacteriaceae bacterium]|nr:DUF748 domain-containing protein [Cyclobacteriaceae bacterium]
MHIQNKKRKVWIFLLIGLFLIIIARIALPYIVLHVANNKLANLRGYYGHVKDVHLSLYKGAYSVDSIYFNKVDSVTQKQTPFFNTTRVDISIEWRALWKGSLVGEVAITSPTLLFTKDKVEPKQLLKDSSYLKGLLDDFMPLQINRVEVYDGMLRYRDEGIQPVLDMEMTNMVVLAENLRNSYDSSALLPAKIYASATLYEGTLTFDMRMNPLAAAPTFDLNAKLINTNLVLLNDFFQAYAKVDVNKGTFGLYAEVASKDGKFNGYMKPLIHGLDVLGKEDRDDNVLRQLWEGIVGTGAQVFKNQNEDQVATKIPLSGTIGKTNINTWYAIMNIMRNAFIQALLPAIDNEVNLANVKDAKQEKKTFLQKVFGKKDG